MYFDLPGGDGEDREGPALAPVSSGDAVGNGAGRYGSSDEEDAGTEPEKVSGFLHLELRSSFWVHPTYSGATL